MLLKIVSVKKGILIIGTPWVGNRPKTFHITQRDFFNLNCVNWRQ